MRYHVPGATALILAALILTTSVASADIVDLSNGARLPKKSEIVTEWGQYPSDNDLKVSGKGNLKLAYDKLTIGSTPGDAAQVSSVYITDAVFNQNFAAAEQHAVRGYWEDAAQAYRMAADDLKGSAQQWALYKRMLAIANTNDPGATLKAADELLASDEKTYYFGPAQETRARVFATNGRLGQALGALKMVTDAKDMNVRDYFSAAYLREWLTKFIRAQSAENYADAEKAFRGLLTELERHPRRQLAAVPRLKIMMSLAASVRAQNRSEEASKIFEEILAGTDERTDKTVLAGVYYGLGDVAFEEAAVLQTRVKAEPNLKPQVKEKLETAALHYLRVILLYKAAAGQREVFGATQGVARAFSQLFKASEEKDCELARRGYDYYVQAVNMMPRGEARRLLVREGKALKARIDEICTSDTPEETEEK